jgi:hypothetical protein
LDGTGGDSGLVYELIPVFQREKAPEGAEVAFIARGILAQNLIRVRLARTSAKPVEGWRKTRRDDEELPIFRRLAQSR